MNDNEKPGSLGSFLAWIPAKPSEKVTVTLVDPNNSVLDFGTKEIEVNSGSKLNADSAGEDYQITQYYTNKELTQEFDYQNTPVLTNTTLYVAGNPMKMSNSYSNRLNGQEDNITEAYFVLSGQEPTGEPILTWDASDGTGAVTAKMYEGGRTYFVAREGATHIWCPDASSLLAFCTKMTKVDGFANLYSVKKMNQTLGANPMLADLGDIARLDTSKVTQLANVFAESSLPANLDLSAWDTSKCMEFNRIFARPKSRTNIDVHGWVIPEGAKIEKVFLGVDKAENGLVSVNAANWDIRANNIDGSYLFAQNAILESINLTGWDFTKFASARQMFWHGYELKSIIFGEGNYLNLPNLQAIDAFAGIYQAFYQCYKLDTFNDTGDPKVDHTLFIRLPNAQLNNTSAMDNIGIKSETPFYIDIDLADSVYEVAGNSEISLATPGSSIISLVGATQVKFFGNYSDKWQGATLTSHSNLVRNAVSKAWMTIVLNRNPIRINNVTYALKIESILMDRFIPTKTMAIGVPDSLKWITASSSLTSTEAELILSNVNKSAETMQLKGYYENGAWSANKAPFVQVYSQLATADNRGYLTSNPNYIDSTKEDTSVIGGTISEFKTALDAGDVSNFPIGTKLPDTANGESNPLIVAQYLDGTQEAYGGAKGAVVVRQFAESTPIAWDTNGGTDYSTSSIRTHLNGDYLSACTEELQNIIEPMTIPYGNIDTTTIQGTVDDKVFLLDNGECINKGNTNPHLGMNFEYFQLLGTSSESRVSHISNGTAVDSWLRNKIDSQKAAYIPSNLGVTSTQRTSSNLYYRPAFFIPQA